MTEAALAVSVYHAVRDAQAIADDHGWAARHAVRSARYELWHEAVRAIEAALRAVMPGAEAATIHRLACHLVDVATAATIDQHVRLAPSVAASLKP